MFPDMFKTADLLAHGLDAAQLRQDTIANNIANVDTPGFKASSVEFESYMKDALENDGTGFEMKTTDGKHIQTGFSDALDVQPQVVTDNNTMRLDGNSVDIDEQMSALAKNTVWYNTLAMKLNGELGRLKTAIDGR